MQIIIDGTQNDRHELYDIFGLFYDVEPISFDIITTSRGDTDFRKSILYLLNFYPLKGDKNAKNTRLYAKGNSGIRPDTGRR